MHASLRGWRSLGVSCLIAALAFGCGGNDPPFDELPLRDALGASPESIASLPAEARRALAERLEEARAAQLDVDSAPLGSNATPAGEVRALDTMRELRGAEALIVTALEHDAEGLSAQPLPGEIERDPSLALPPLEGPASTITRDAEESALDGRAGVVLGELLKSADADRLVRVSEWPAGAVAIDGVVYVNASWLVALAALDDAVPRAKSPSPPSYRPLAVGGNPYLTYGSLDACTKDVTQRCESCLASGGCDPHATLADFESGEDECRFLAEDPDRPRQLCALALLSIGTVGACVRSGAPSCALPSATNQRSDLSLAMAFLAEDRCVQALSTCLAGDTPSSGTDIDINISTDGCQNPFTACASAFSTLDKSCKSRSCTGSGNQSCTSCSSCKSTRTGSTCGGGGGGNSGTSGSATSTGTNTSTSTGAGAGSATSTGAGAGSATSTGAGAGSGSSGSGTSGASSGSGGSTGSGGSCSSSSCSNCKSCSSCKSCGSSGGSSSNCKCQTEEEEPITEPIGAVAWLLAPLLYVSRRARRRS